MFIKRALLRTGFILFIHKVCGEDIVSWKTNETTILGRQLYTVFDSKPYVAFYKIPFSEPPIGDLRFKPPKALQWFNKQSYNYTRPFNYSSGLEYDENVLYLTIYMPNSKSTNYNTPVVVWLHEDSCYHGPDFLIEEDVIVVSISFRTSIFGFLNTEDEFARGNMAAKDILLGLKWIREYIIYFHGDPNRVTVIGSGIAANIVASFLLSPLAEDLFINFVVQSGSVLDPTIYKSYNFEILNKLYWNLCGWTEKFDRTRLYKLLISTPGHELIKLSRHLFDSTEVRDDQRLFRDFGPTVEYNKIEAFIDEFPTELLAKRKINKEVKVMMGYTSLESMYKLKGFANNRRLLKYLNDNFQYLLPFEGKKDEYGGDRYKKIRRKIMDFYFVNGTITERSLRRYGKYISDQVIYSVLRQARLHAEMSRNRVYLYRFSFRGSLSIVWNSTLNNLNWSSATAGDEICYQFRCKSLRYNDVEASDERHFIKKIARLLANFAKYGNPTPEVKDEILEDLRWDSLVDTFKGLNMGRKFKMVTLPEKERFLFWDQLRTKYYPIRKIKDEL